MMKFIDWINLKLDLSNKKDFDYDCTYAWSVLTKFSFILFAAAIVIFTILYSNLISFAFEYMVNNQYVNDNLKRDDLPLLIMITVLLNICLLHLIALTNTQIGRVLKTIFTYFYKVLEVVLIVFGLVLFVMEKIWIAIKSPFYYLMNRYCNKVIK